ncbi:putative cold shock protein A [compost metagenome]
MRGIVKFYNATKGFGFVKSPDLVSDVFVHVSHVASDNITLQEGDTVAFTLANTNRGPIATGVQLIYEG